MEMAAYLVIPVAHSAELGKRIQLAGIPHVRLARNQWLVGFEGDCRSLHQLILMSESDDRQPIASAIVIEALPGRYYGHAHAKVWDFLVKYQRAQDDSRLGYWGDQDTGTATDDTYVALDPNEYHTRAEWKAAGWPDSDWWGR